MRTFEPKILGAVKNGNKKQLLKDIISGIIVAIIALPLSIALAIASGVSPEKGLYTAVVAGFFTAVFGGSNVNITGPTAAFATIVAGIVVKNGIEGLTVATIMAGCILILLGVLKLGKLIKYIPYTLTVGFTAGIAVTLVIGQLKDFFGITYNDGLKTVETLDKFVAVIKSISTFNIWAFVLGAVSVAMMLLWPKKLKMIPPSLVAVIFGVVVVLLTPFTNIKTIGDLYTITAGLPKVTLPSIDFKTVLGLIPNAFVIAILAAIESLLSCVVSDEMIGDKHNSNTELIGLGIGNIASGFFGGIPATGAIARTAANVNNGGRTPFASIFHTIVLLLVLVVLMPLASYIPMPTIAAILIVVAYNMSGIKNIVKIFKKDILTDILVMLATLILTVVFNLVVAIAVGMVLSVVFNLFKKEKVFNAKYDYLGSEKLVIEYSGFIFFSNAELVKKEEINEEVKEVTFDLKEVSHIGLAGINKLYKLVTNLKNKGTFVEFINMSESTVKAFKRSKLKEYVIEE